MAAGGPSGHDDPLAVTAERGQLPGKKVDAGEWAKSANVALKARLA